MRAAASSGKSGLDSVLSPRSLVGLAGSGRAEPERVTGERDEENMQKLGRAPQAAAENKKAPATRGDEGRGTEIDPLGVEREMVG